MYVGSKSSFPKIGREAVIGLPPANGSDRSVQQMFVGRNAWQASERLRVRLGREGRLSPLTFILPLAFARPQQPRAWNRLDSVSLRMNTIASRDLGEPITIRENLVVNYQRWYLMMLKAESTRPIQILLGNFSATFRILSNVFVREQLLATFWKTQQYFLVTFGLF